MNFLDSEHFEQQAPATVECYMTRTVEVGEFSRFIIA